ncbi:hypothetical protein HPB49_012183 [Dermacentor silvarum]|uniref:Uncharacterized protein n=1 Tax=Dermacentor silvarum TaxID=543639 RepID=A0ACB8C908_DERSI|nr:hypothetical protein HPB49_012183 [Dermacentor silvarum]
MDSHLLQLWKAKAGLERRWQRQRWNTTFRRRLTQLNKETETHAATRSRQNCGSLCNRLEHNMSLPQTWNLFRHLIDSTQPGLQAGYFEAVNLDSVDRANLEHAMMESLPPMMCQVALDCLVKPPSPGDASYEMYSKEKAFIINSLAERARMAEERLNAIKGIHCSPVQGSMAAYPRMTIPAKAIEEAQVVDGEANAAPGRCATIVGLLDVSLEVSSLAVQLVAEDGQEALERVGHVGQGNGGQTSRGEDCDEGYVGP